MSKSQRLYDNDKWFLIITAIISLPLFLSEIVLYIFSFQILLLPFQRLSVQRISFGSFWKLWRNPLFPSSEDVCRCTWKYSDTGWNDPPAHGPGLYCCKNSVTQTETSAASGEYIMNIFGFDILSCKMNWLT